MSQLKRIGVILSALALLFGVASLVSIVHPRPLVHAQIGATGVPGYVVSASNAVVNAAIGSGGAVTNPASNFIVLVQGSTIYCGGSAQTIGQSTLTPYSSTTFQLEWNCVV